MRFKNGSDWTKCLPLIAPPGGKQPRTYQEFFNIIYGPLFRDIIQKNRDQPKAQARKTENLYYKGDQVVGYKRAPIGTDFILLLENGEQVQLTIMEFVRSISTADEL